jgi:pilus assembly protein CpaE
LKIFQDLGFPGREKVEILINRSQKRNLISPNEAEKTLNKPIFWSIPNNFQVTTSAINQGIPIPLLEPKSELAKNFMDLALILTGKKIA